VIIFSTAINIIENKMLLLTIRMYDKLQIMNSPLSFKPPWINFNGRSQILSVAFLLIPFRICWRFNIWSVLASWLWSLTSNLLELIKISLL
jgi:hypothetical protein